ncbi:LOW QUALITY PROTEIN: protein IQ-DOMAIN 14-like [Phalaenopsis equestris]|uniref:LOW QUALITY PROTEIN: protein IQ-DOMAIN 14-like n=1 Tax=Phalaenopsis equestris TaxID=78828 RepID=UPI0009E2221D|nr:LOW QUALITY PROTEIN: protein IQ-DOMAIN 14-like [Phalaenopsis equestris]
MGKKGGWISALKRAFTPKSKEKFATDPENYVTEKKQGPERRRHGELNSFIPLYREPSTIEKILGDIEKEQQYKAQQVSIKRFVQQFKSPITRQNNSANTSKNVVSAKVDSSYVKTTVAPYKVKSIIPRKQAIRHNSKSITSNYDHISATKIQAAYKGYMARKSYKALKGLLRLKKMMEGQSVKRQTMNTMRSMQLLVRIQAQIHARRHQLMENQNIHQNQVSWRSRKEAVSCSSKWNTSYHQQWERDAYDEWDDSMLTKEEKDSNVKRKVEAVIKKERALAYACSHQLLTTTPKAANAALKDARSGGVPAWENWFESQITSVSRHAKTPEQPTHRPSSAATTAGAAHQRLSSRSKPPKTPFDGSTPRFSKPLQTHNSSNRWQATHMRPTLRDDDSLTSCPAFTAPLAASGISTTVVPNYMAPTVSAKAKVKAAAMESGRGAKEGRRFSFALSQSIGSLKLFSAMKIVAPPVPPPKVVSGRHRSTPSVGELSVDSTVSLPAGIGRRPSRESYNARPA